MKLIRSLNSCPMAAPMAIAAVAGASTMARASLNGMAYAVFTTALPTVAVAQGPAQNLSTKVGKGEIRLDGVLRQYKSAVKTIMVLEVRSFRLPNGKTGKLKVAKQKKIVFNDATMILDEEGDSDFKPGDKIFVIGKDGGSGKPLTPRVVSFVRLPGFKPKPAAVTSPSITLAAPQPLLSFKGDTAGKLIGFDSVGNFITLNGDLVATVRDARTGTETGKHNLKGENGRIFGAALSRDGKALAISTAAKSDEKPGQIVLWNTQTWQAAPPITAVLEKGADGESGEYDGYSVVVFSADGKTLATTGDDNPHLRIWDIDSGRLKRTILRQGDSSSKAISLSVDGSQIAAKSGQSLEIWDTSTGAKVLSRQLKNSLDAMAFSPNGKWLLQAGFMQMDVLDTTSWNPVTSFRIEGQMSSVVFSPDGKIVAVEQGRNGIPLWSMGDWKPLTQQPVATNGGYDTQVAISPDDKTLSTASGYAHIQGISATTSDPLYALDLEPMEGLKSTSPDGKTLILQNQATVKIVDAPTAKTKYSLQSAGSPVMSPHGDLLAASQPKSIVVWDLATGQQRSTWKFEQYLSPIAFLPGGKVLAANSRFESQPKGGIVLIDVATGKEMKTIQTPLNNMSGETLVSFSGDGKKLATRGKQNTGEIMIWDTTTGNLVHTVTLENPQVDTFALSPDGKWLVGKSYDEKIFLWDTATWKNVKTIDVEWVKEFQFSPDGSTLAMLRNAGEVPL